MLPWSQIARLGGACGALLLAACVEQPKRNRPSKKLAPKPKPTRECQEGESCFIPKENFQKLYSQVLKNGATHPVQTIDTDGNPTLFKLPSHLKAILEIGKYWDEVSSGKIEQIDGVIDTENVSEETIRIQPNDQVQRWLPTKRHLFRTSKSSVSLNFSDAVSGEALSCASAVVWHVVANPKGDGFLNYFVTNEHVIGDIGKITEVVDVDGRECRVTLKNVTAVGKAKDWFGNETEFKIDRILMKKKKPDLGVFVVKTKNRIFEPVKVRRDIPTNQYVAHKVLIQGFFLCVDWWSVGNVVGVTENDVHIDGHINQGGSGGPGADYDTAELIFLNMAIYSGDDVGGMGIGLPIYSVAPMIDGVIEEDLDRRENLTAQSILFQQTLPSDESEAPDCTARETKKYFRRKKSSAEELSSQVEFPEEISMSSRVSPY